MKTQYKHPIPEMCANSINSRDFAFFANKFLLPRAVPDTQ